MSSHYFNSAKFDGISLGKGRWSTVSLNNEVSEQSSYDDIGMLQNKLDSLQRKLEILKESTYTSQTKRVNGHQKRNKGFAVLDYSVSILLLIISVFFGFNLALYYGFQQGSEARTAVAGVSEIVIPVQTSNGEITSDFENWLNDNYSTIQSESTEQSNNENSSSNEQEAKKLQDLPPLTTLFNANDLNDLNQQNINKTSFETEARKFKDTISIIEQAEKIDGYINAFRSYEEFDNQLQTPVKGMTYLAVSQQTGIPIHYLLAIARMESRFGTDRFTVSGSPTRPGLNRNICSIGLDDVGGNLGFASWEEGLLACGKWYQYFEQKGVPDCQKWKIFNPNGNYCAKVESVSQEIKTFLQK